MRDIRRGDWLRVATCWLCLWAAWAAAQGYGPLRVGERLTQQETLQYVAIMGQVARSGVYEVRLPVELADVVRRAGGLTEEASGNMRIVRGGRGGQQANFTTQTRYELLPGDLVIADRKHVGQFQAEANRLSGRTDYSANFPGPLSTAAGANRPNVVQVGLVHVLDRPVVLDLPAEHATVKGILSLLYQPATANNSVTVLKAGTSPQSVPFEQGGSVVLTSGSVLVFDRKQVDASLLPQLPPPILAEAALPATASPPAPLPAGTTGDALPERNAGAAVPSPMRVGDDSANWNATQPFAADVPGSLAISPQEPLTAVVPAIVEDLPDARSAPAAGVAQEDRSNHLKKTAARPAPDANAGPSATPKVMIAVTGGIFVLVLSGLWWIERRSARRIATRAARSQPMRPPARSALDALIENKLPVIEEPVPAPNVLHVFGRPIDAGRYRLDAAEGLQGPHFLPKTAAQQKSAAEPKPPRAAGRVYRTDQAHPPQNPPERSNASHDDKSPAVTDAGLLDRVLKSVQREKP